MKTIYLDIMLCGRFYCQLKFRYCPPVAITEDEVRYFVETKVPYLRGKKFKVAFSNAMMPTH